MLLQANTDLLTGCCNRRSFYELIKARRIYEKNYCILMFDIDEFKLINDKYGHDAGDVVLKTFGKLLLTSTRKDDIVCRYGGEEFVVYLHGVSSKTLSFIKADAIRKLIESFVVVSDEVKIKFTISIGVAVNTDEARDIQDVIQIADNNLFKSKNTGRNKTTI
nr:GGDEF domain-containing protein [Clostridium frigoris]